MDLRIKMSRKFFVTNVVYKSNDLRFITVCLSHNLSVSIIIIFFIIFT
jgi:hypothetical protein